MIETLKNSLRRNKLKKFIALTVSMALWFFVMGSQNPIIKGSYNAKVSMANVPREYVALFKDQEVKVKLSAPRSYFVDYNDSDIRAFANMSGYGEGEYEVPIEASFPKGFELIEITPATMQVKVDPLIEKQMPAEVIFTGSPKEGLVIAATRKSSDNLTVFGSKTDVEKVNRVIGYADLSDKEENFELQVPMSVIDENGRIVNGVRAMPSVITVGIDLKQDTVTKPVQVVVDMTPPVGKEFGKIIFNPSEVELTGAEEAVKDIEYLKTESFRVPRGEDIFRGSLRLVVPYGLSVNVYDIYITAELKDQAAEVEAESEDEPEAETQ